MKVLVTGGRGFVGSPTVAALNTLGYEVVAPRRIDYNLLSKTDRQRLLHETRPDALVHLAWQTAHGAFWTAPDNKQWQVASIDLVNRFFEGGGRRAVMAGSCAEYDWTTQAPLLKENAPCNPATLYGRCKLETLESCASLVDAGASIAWGRLFFLLGPAETPTRFVPAIVRPLLAGQTASMGSGTAIRDFMHTHDAGAAFAKLVDSSLTGPVNIASGDARSLLDLAQMAARLADTGHLDVGALPDRPDEPAILAADVTRLRKELDFASIYTPESAIADCVAYWRREALNS